MASTEFHKPLLEGIASHLHSLEFADATIKYDQEEFKVHRIVLSTQSKFFYKAFTGEWKETADCTIKLKDDDILIVAAMLRFFYTFDYDAGGNTADVMSPTVFNVKMYSIGDKYDVPALKMLARQKFEESAKACWDMDDFPHAIAEVYKSTPPTDRGLRDLARDISLKNIKPLLKKQRFNDVLNEVVGFASDLVRAQSVKPDEEKSLTKVICPNCTGSWGIDSKKTGGNYCPHCAHLYTDWLSYAVH